MIGSEGIVAGKLPLVMVAGFQRRSENRAAPDGPGGNRSFSAQILKWNLQMAATSPKRSSSERQSCNPRTRANVGLVIC